VKRRRIDPRRAKIHRTYSVEEAARLFGTHRNTVRSWLRAGLIAIDGDRPVLIPGSELRRYLTERRAKARCPTRPGMIHCLGCREARRPAGDMVDYFPRTDTSGNLQGICPDCDSMLNRGAKLADLEAICADLDVTIRERAERIRQRKEPSLNHDSTVPPSTHAN
jgi:excisionase family DNA binding protein